MARAQTLAQGMRRWGVNRSIARRRVHDALEELLPYRVHQNDQKYRALALAIFDLERTTAEAARRTERWSNARRTVRP